MVSTLKEALHLSLLALFLACALMGCTSLEAPPEPAKPRLTTAARKPAPKELGSLWSEDSTWNNVYTLAAARVSGDIITVKLDENFRKRLSASTEEGRDWEKKMAKLNEPNPDRSVASAPAAEKAAPGDLALRGNIDEVGTRGVYRIAVADTLRLNQWEPYVVIKGRVRDRDIDANDEVKVADIVDLEFEVLKGVPGDREAEDVSW